MSLHDDAFYQIFGCEFCGCEDSRAGHCCPDAVNARERGRIARWALPENRLRRVERILRKHLSTAKDQGRYWSVSALEDALSAATDSA